MLKKTLKSSSLMSLFSNIRHCSSFKSLASDGKGNKKINRHLRAILQNNKKWVEETNLKEPEFFKNLSKIQTPKYLYFGCSDSRVPANEILGLKYVFISIVP
jgi:hypothetical protein